MEAPTTEETFTSSSSFRRAFPTFVQQVTSQDGSRQSLGITCNGNVYSWGPKHSLGQLGRSVTTQTPAKRPALVKYADHSNNIKATRIFVGGFADAGHSAIIDEKGQLWMAGCDRWQQLGLGSPAAGAAGYTWLHNGRIYHSEFVLNTFVTPLLQSYDDQATIRDIALGGDHTVVLSSNKRDVITFGKG
jgi:alpha-tubulin suppressor-like RCC1 family protein